MGWWTTSFCASLQHQQPGHTWNACWNTIMVVLGSKKEAWWFTPAGNGKIHNGSVSLLVGLELLPRDAMVPWDERRGVISARTKQRKWAGSTSGSCCSLVLSLTPHCCPGNRRPSWTIFQYYGNFIVAPQAFCSGPAQKCPMWCLAGWMWSTRGKIKSLVLEDRNKLQKWESSLSAERRQPDGLLDLSSFLNFYKYEKKLDKDIGLQPALKELMSDAWGTFGCFLVGVLPWTWTRISLKQVSLFLWHAGIMMFLLCLKWV